MNLAHKEILTKGKLELLKMAAAHVAGTMQNDVSIQLFSSNINHYNNFQKLRYHGLIYYKQKNGQRIRGHWVITRNGWSFLRGEINLPQFVIVQDNHIISRSDQLINVRDVYYGSLPLETRFEYFDEAGQPVGIRPHQQSFNQLSLIV